MELGHLQLSQMIMTATKKTHWTDQMRQENAALKAEIAQLKAAILTPTPVQTTVPVVPQVVASVATLDAPSAEPDAPQPVMIFSPTPPPDMMVVTNAEGAPAMSAILGDLTPGWPEWSLQHEGPGGFKARYGKRWQSLPVHLQVHAK